jgi:hypothetical protein
MTMICYFNLLAVSHCMLDLASYKIMKLLHTIDGLTAEYQNDGEVEKLFFLPV